jgi:hypothetical protein
MKTHLLTILNLMVKLKSLISFEDYDAKDGGKAIRPTST